MTIPTVPVDLAIEYGAKAFKLTWTPSPGAERYEIREDSNRSDLEPAVVVGESTAANYVHLPDALLWQRSNAWYDVRACNSAGCSEWTDAVHPNATMKAIGYVKADDVDPGDSFGTSVALSADGQTMVVGMPGEDGSDTSVAGSMNDGAYNAGAAYVYTRTAQGWQRQAYLKAGDAKPEQGFGYVVAISADGSTIAIGAPHEDGGLDPDAPDQEATRDSGAVYVFTKTGAEWSWQARLKAGNAGKEDHFGTSVALSGDGNTLAVGAPDEDGVTDSTLGSGATYVFARTGAAWEQQRYLSVNPGLFDYFGSSVALSGNGNLLAVGARHDDSTFIISGAVYVFTREGGDWSQPVQIKPDVPGLEDGFGASIALSSGGTTLIVGAPNEDGGSSGLTGNPADNSKADAGAAYVFTRIGTAWQQQLYVKASNTDEGDQFGTSVSISADGTLFVVGAHKERSAATGVDGNQLDNSRSDRGAAYVFAHNGSAWSNRAYLKSSNLTTHSHSFGRSVAMAGNASTIAIGAPDEPGSSPGVQGDQAPQGAFGAGAVYLY